MQDNFVPRSIVTKWPRIIGGMGFCLETYEKGKIDMALELERNIVMILAIWLLDRRGLGSNLLYSFIGEKRSYFALRFIKCW